MCFQANFWHVILTRKYLGSVYESRFIKQTLSLALKSGLNNPEMRTQQIRIASKPLVINWVSVCLRQLAHELFLQF